MAFEALAEAAERWCARTPFQLIAAEETERRMDFYAEPGVSFYVLCPEAACGDNFAEIPFTGSSGDGLQADFASSASLRELHIKFHLQGRIIFALMAGRQREALALPEGFTAAEDAEKEKTEHDFQHVWSESEDCLPFLQLAQDYISSCGKKTLHEILEKVFKSFRPLLGLPDVDDDAFEEYNADVEEEEPEADHQQMGVSQQ
ncbi:hypothetical protein DUI87_18449 [Hirundo rustica rustica]|uniref:Maturin n=1 Tax=Hirundo rustica rustica TaxID=333673 RepID=A0A3M0K1Y1_HIRRU|nr:hypothetical protein DUI87_18449 [Hirundo rustica rustica]